MSIENDKRGHVSGATVVWGVILLVIAGVAFAVAMFDVSALTPAVVGWGIVGIGGLLVVAAIVGAIARAVRPGVSTGSTTVGTTNDDSTKGQPIG